jgi:tetratricopeptide (TPR) repeat protein
MLPGTSRATRRAVVLLLLAGGLTYANAFWGVFQFDDERVILQDSRLESLARFVDHLPQMIRPVTKLTFFVDRWFLGASPAGYHLLNLLLHLANGLLVFALLRAVRVAPGLQPRPALAFWTALVFLVHPLGSEAVTYVSGRPTLLATFFGLAAMCLATGAAARPAVRPDTVAGRGRGRRATTVLLAGSLAMALLSKETAVVFPALLLLWHIIFGRAAPERGSRIARAHHLAAWGTLASFLLAATLHARYGFLFTYALGLRGWVENLLSQAYAVTYAATLILAPAPWRLSFDHDLPLVTSVWQWPAPLCLVAIAAVFVLAIVAARRAPVFSFGLLWFFVCLAPTNSILPRYDLLSERNLYLPSIGVFIALVDRLAAGGARLAAALPAVTGAPRAARWLLPTAAVLLLAGITVDRNRLYADPVTLWEDAVRKSPRKARPHTNYGYALYRAGQTDRAIREFRAALAIDPDDPDAQRNLRRAWSAADDPTAAGRRE